MRFTVTQSCFKTLTWNMEAFCPFFIKYEGDQLTIKWSVFTHVPIIYYRKKTVLKQILGLITVDETWFCLAAWSTFIIMKELLHF